MVDSNNSAISSQQVSQKAVSTASISVVGEGENPSLSKPFDSVSGDGSSSLSFDDEDFEAGRYWKNFSKTDLLDLMLGSDSRGLRGYFNYDSKRTTQIREKLDLSVDQVELGESGQGLGGLEWLEKFVKRYVGYCSSHRLYFFNDEEEKWDWMPHIWRGSVWYMNRMKSKLISLKSHIEAKVDDMVHLRISPRVGEDESPLEILMEMKNKIPKFFKALRQKVLNEEVIDRGKRKGRENAYNRYRCSLCGSDYKYKNEARSCVQSHDVFPEYFTVWESKDGFIHIHVLFFGVKYLVDKEWIEDWMIENDLGGEAGSWINRVDRNKGERTYQYVLKYLNKSYNDPYFLALLILSKRRTWSSSSKVKEWMKHDYRGEENRNKEFVGKWDSCSCKSNYNYLKVQHLPEIMRTDKDLLATGRVIETSKWTFVGSFPFDVVDWVFPNLFSRENPPGVDEFRRVVGNEVRLLRGGEGNVG